MHSKRDERRQAEALANALQIPHFRDPEGGRRKPFITRPSFESATRASCRCKRHLMRGARHRRVLVPAQARTLVALWLRLRIAMSCGMVTSLSRQVISRGKFRSRSVSAWSLAGSKGLCARSSRCSGSGSYSSLFSCCATTSRTSGLPDEHEERLVGVAAHRDVFRHWCLNWE